MRPTPRAPTSPASPYTADLPREAWDDEAIDDALERALEAAERHEEATLVDGVKLVEQSLRKALVKEGLTEIETAGPFDPHVHEAMLAQPGDGAESGSVLEVVQRGYRIGDKIVRPARVIVAE